jgi:hypothetical protein
LAGLRDRAPTTCGGRPAPELDPPPFLLLDARGGVWMRTYIHAPPHPALFATVGWGVMPLAAPTPPEADAASCGFSVGRTIISSCPIALNSSSSMCIAVASAPKVAAELSLAAADMARRSEEGKAGSNWGPRTTINRSLRMETTADNLTSDRSNERDRTHGPRHARARGPSTRAPLPAPFVPAKGYARRELTRVRGARAKEGPASHL